MPETDHAAPVVDTLSDGTKVKVRIPRMLETLKQTIRKKLA